MKSPDELATSRGAKVAGYHVLVEYNQRGVSRCGEESGRGVMSDVDVYQGLTGDQIATLVADRCRAAHEASGASPRLNATLINALQDIIVDLVRTVKAREMWSCEECAFTFWAEHRNEDGSMTCPLCELVDAQRDQADAERQRDEAMHEAVEAGIALTEAGVPEAYSRDDVDDGRELDLAERVRWLAGQRDQSRALRRELSEVRDRWQPVIEAVLDADIAALPTEVRDARLALQFPNEVTP